MIDAGRPTTFAYDATGQLATVTDPLGITTRLTSDSVGRPLTVQYPVGTIAFSYDTAGHLQTLTPAGQPAHAFTYTLGGLPSTYVAPAVAGVSSTTTSYQYDADLRLRSIVRPSGDSITTIYDAAGRPTSVTHADATTTFAYSALAGVLSTLASNAGDKYSLTYDGALVTSATLSGGAVSGSVAYGYDNFFRPTSVAVNGSTVTLGYDMDGLLTSAGAFTLARSATTGLASRAVVDGAATSYTYDSTGALISAATTANGSALYTYTLTRDVLDRIVRRVETVAAVTSDTRFAYDSAGRLSDVTRDGAPYASYLYDANGNRTRRTSSVGIETGLVDAQDRLTSNGGTTYQYTDAGELRLAITGPDTTTYHYDAMGALRWVTLPGGTRIDYVIDALGRRIGKKVNSVLTQGFLYESELRVAAELTPSGAVLSRFVYGTQANVPEYMVRGGTRYRLITDHLGSVRLVVDAVTGAVQQRIDYDEYGRVLTNTNPGFQPFGFAGGLLDDVTGLVRFGMRDYDGRNGRWTARDPLGFGGGDANLFAYVGADPINRRDPTGNRPLSACSQNLLQPYFDGIDLSKVDLTIGNLPLLPGFGGITIGNSIYLDQSYFESLGVTERTTLLAHELTHVEQYAQIGIALDYSTRTGRVFNSSLRVPAFMEMYIPEAIKSIVMGNGMHAGNRFEIDAKRSAAQVTDLIAASGKPLCACQ